MQRLISIGAAENREEAYRLLSQRAPARVMVDNTMPTDTWTIVRGPTTFERDELDRYESQRRELLAERDQAFRESVARGAELAEAAKLHLATE